jgi:hypothetical protein
LHQFQGRVSFFRALSGGPHDDVGHHLDAGATERGDATTHLLYPCPLFEELQDTVTSTLDPTGYACATRLGEGLGDVVVDVRGAHLSTPRKG